MTGGLLRCMSPGADVARSQQRLIGCKIAPIPAHRCSLVDILQPTVLARGHRCDLMRCADAQIALSNGRRGAGDRDACGERRRSEPERADQYAQRAGGCAAGLLGAAADRTVASRHANHGADKLQAQRRAVRTAEDHISIGDASDAERASYRTAVAETLKRCASLPFTEALGNGMAGEPLAMRFIDDRERPPD